MRETVRAQGQWRISDSVTVAAPFKAYVEALRPRAGDAVARGETIGSLVTYESRAALRIDARIVRLERVTVESRALNGVVAGRARVIADVMLIEEATGRVVARFTVEGQSSSAGTTEQAIKRASEQVVALMAARFNG